MSKLPNGWVEVKLNEVIASANTGLDAIKRAPIVEEDTGIKCFRIQDASQKKDYHDWGFTNVNTQNFEKFKLTKGDILIARTGNSIGVHYLVQKNIKSVFNNGLIRLRVNEKIKYDFLYKIITSKYFYRYVQSIAYGTSTQPNMQINSLLNFKFLLPSKEEQKAISNMLLSFDKKIELLKVQNKTLKTMAQTIFKEWFVNFNFPNTTGEMKDSDIGFIPKGWKIGKIGDIVDIYDSKRIPLSSKEREKIKGDYPYYGATKIMDYINDYIFDGTYLLFAEDGSVIDDNNNPILQYVWGKFWVNNHTHILQGKNGFTTELLYVMFKNINVTSIVTGAVQLKINQTNLLNYKVLIPDKITLNNFNILIEPMFKKIKNNTYQIKTLEKTRDTFLPKLMRGEIRLQGFGN